jgi:hypothetical protein
LDWYDAGVLGAELRDIVDGAWRRVKGRAGAEQPR